MPVINNMLLTPTLPSFSLSLSRIKCKMSKREKKFKKFEREKKLLNFKFLNASEKCTSHVALVAS